MTIRRPDLTNTHEDAKKFAETFSDTLSNSEMGFLCEGINSYAIPEPQLLIKDHKDPNEHGNFLTHLVIPAKNFMETFSNIGIWFKGETGETELSWEKS
eukprot:7127895-Ditylum_brightwellii.AAC.1